MKSFHFVADYYRRERATSWMLIVIIGVLVVSAFMQVSQNSAKESALPDASRGAGEKMERRNVAVETKAKIEELQKDPKWMMRIGLMLALVLASGLIIDFMFFSSAGSGFWRPGNEPDAPWGPAMVFNGFVALFFAEIVVSVCGIGLTSASNQPFSGNILLMAVTFFRNALTALYVFMLVRRRFGAGLASLGLTAVNWVKNIQIGLAAYAGFFPVYFAILLVIMGALKLAGYEPPMQNIVEMIYKEDNVTTLIVFGFFIAFIGPLFEEVFFRGFVYRGFRKRWGMMPAIVITSILFAAMHAHWIALAPIFALSMILCFLYEKTGSIVPGGVLHMVHNIVTLSMMLGVKFFEK